MGVSWNGSPSDFSLPEMPSAKQTGRPICLFSEWATLERTESWLEYRRLASACHHRIKELEIQLDTAQRYAERSQTDAVHHGTLQHTPAARAPRNLHRGVRPPVGPAARRGAGYDPEDDDARTARDMEAAQEAMPGLGCLGWLIALALCIPFWWGVLVAADVLGQAGAK